MDRIIKSYIDNFVVSQQIEESNISTVFEMFSCYCALSKEYDENFNIDDMLTGNGGDCGIDGIAIILNGVLINSIDEANDIIEINKNINDLKFIFVQGKTSSNFSGSELGTFGFGVLDFFKENPEMVRNESITEKNKISEYLFSKAVLMKNKPKCIMYYVTTGKWTGDQNLSARINGISNDLTETNLFSEVVFSPVDANLLQKYYKATIDKIERTIDFPNRIPLPEMDKIVESYLGILPAKEYVKLITEDEEIIKSLFYDNVRDYQGENDVNQEIKATLKTRDSSKFVILNNGVTIICKELRNIVRNQFQLSDYQIVNGCQTSHVLYHSRQELNDRVFITLKIISTTDEETVNKIIKATNRQTEVTDEQMLSLTDFHKKLEDFYKTFNGTKKLYYERRSKQYATASDIEKVRIVTLPLQLKSFASMFMDKPHISSRYFGRLIKDAEGVFQENHKLLPYYTSAFALYKLEYLFRNKQFDLKYRKYRYHILMIMKYRCLNGKNTPPLNSNDIEKLCESINEVMYDHQRFSSLVAECLQVLDKAVMDMTNTDNPRQIAIVEDLKSIAQVIDE